MLGDWNTPLAKWENPLGISPRQLEPFSPLFTLEPGGLTAPPPRPNHSPPRPGPCSETFGLLPGDLYFDLTSQSGDPYFDLTSQPGDLFFDLTSQPGDLFFDLTSQPGDLFFDLTSQLGDPSENQHHLSELCRPSPPKPASVPPDFSRGPYAMKRFPCTFEGCSKTFTRKYNANAHLRTHYRHYPAQCEICGNRFTRQADLARHKKDVHLRQRRYYCDSCYLSFSRSDTLSRLEPPL
jgi:hypothetical protein